MPTCDWLFRRTADSQEVVPCTDRFTDASYVTHRRRWSSHTGLDRQRSVTRAPGSFSGSNGININTTRTTLADDTNTERCCGFQSGVCENAATFRVKDAESHLHR